MNTHPASNGPLLIEDLGAPTIEGEEKPAKKKTTRKKKTTEEAAE